MEIELTPKLQSMVERRVASGQFDSPLDVIADALTLQEEAAVELEARRRAFDEEIGRRLEEMDRGEFITAEELRDHFRQRGETIRAQRAAQAA